MRYLVALLLLTGCNWSNPFGAKSMVEPVRFGAKPLECKEICAPNGVDEYRSDGSCLCLQKSGAVREARGCTVTGGYTMCR